MPKTLCHKWVLLQPCYNTSLVFGTIINFYQRPFFLAGDQIKLFLFNLDQNFQNYLACIFSQYTKIRPLIFTFWPLEQHSPSCPSRVFPHTSLALSFLQVHATSIYNSHCYCKNWKFPLNGSEWLFETAEGLFRLQKAAQTQLKATSIFC